VKCARGYLESTVWLLILIGRAVDRGRISGDATGPTRWSLEPMRDGGDQVGNKSRVPNIVDDVVDEIDSDERPNTHANHRWQSLQEREGGVGIVSHVHQRYGGRLTADLYRSAWPCERMAVVLRQE